jgi:hypothetical protein
MIAGAFVPLTALREVVFFLAVIFRLLVVFFMRNVQILNFFWGAKPFECLMDQSLPLISMDM